MKYFFATTIIFASAFFFTEQATAIVEIRAHYGLLKGSPDAYNSAYYDFQDGPKLEEIFLLGGILAETGRLKRSRN